MLISLRRKTGMLLEEISEFGLLIADEDGYELPGMGTTRA
jgi:hypothetical protein